MSENTQFSLMTKATDAIENEDAQNTKDIVNQARINYRVGKRFRNMASIDDLEKFDE